MLAKRHGDQYVSVTQHHHSLLELVLAQPGMGRQPGALLEGPAEMEAPQAGIRRQGRERDVGPAVRAQALHDAAQRHRGQPARGRLDQDRRAGVISQEPRGQEIGQLLSVKRN